MKKSFKKTAAALALAYTGIFAGSALVPTSATAAGLMQPVNSSQPALEIRSHKVDVMIENGYAITQVDQVFSNPAGQDLEAVYHFPVPEKAAVSEFTVWIDGQPVIGEVLEKEQAQRVYNEEKAAGREAGLTSKNAHYNFEIRVSPVRAAQDTRIRLVYMQPVDIDTGIGRYVYPLEDGGTDDAASAFWTSNTEVKEEFSFNLDLRSGYEVTGARVPAHPQAAVTKSGSDSWNVKLGNQLLTGISAADSAEADGVPLTIDESESPVTPAATSQQPVSLDKDVVVYWRLADDVPGSVDLVTHKPPGANRGTFMLTLNPGDDLGAITEGRDWMFVLDMSGSMSGKYHTLVDGVQRALGKLNPNDRFRIVRFNNSASELTNGWVSNTPENVQHWSNQLAQTQPGGGTNLYAGTEQGLKALDSDRTSAIVLVTDGEANVGTQEKKHFLKLMEKFDVRLFTAVMGNGSNRPLLEAMTEVSNGFAVSVSNSDDIVGKLMEFTSKATHEALHDIDLKIRGVRTSDLTPTVTTTLYRGEQLMVLGHYADGGEATVSLSGKISGESKLYEARFDFPAISESNPEIERLWAYAKTRDLQQMIDYLGDDSEYKSAIVDIAVANGLVTDHTSMVVVREEQFAAHGIDRNNQDRRQREMQAASERQKQAVQSTRVDADQPAFSKPRASYSSGGSSNGGGAFTMEILMVTPFLLMLLMRQLNKRRPRKQVSIY